MILIINTNVKFTLHMPRRHKAVAEVQLHPYLHRGAIWWWVVHAIPD